MAGTAGWDAGWRCAKRQRLSRVESLFFMSHSLVQSYRDAHRVGDDSVAQLNGLHCPGSCALGSIQTKTARVQAVVFRRFISPQLAGGLARRSPNPMHPKWSWYHDPDELRQTGDAVQRTRHEAWFASRYSIPRTNSGVYGQVHRIQEGSSCIYCTIRVFPGPHRPFPGSSKPGHRDALYRQCGDPRSRRPQRPARSFVLPRPALRNAVGAWLR